MDYALLAIGITLLVALYWVVTALYDLKDRATYHTDHLNAIQRQIAAIPTPEAPDMSALNAISEKVASFAPPPLLAPPDSSLLDDIRSRLGMLGQLKEALERKRDEPARRAASVPVVPAAPKVRAGREALRQRLAQRAGR
jgi:hypothetical protein